MKNKVHFQSYNWRVKLIKKYLFTFSKYLLVAIPGGIVFLSLIRLITGEWKAIAGTISITLITVILMTMEDHWKKKKKGYYKQ